MQKKGRIIKGIAGFYYVQTGDGCLYECKAKGSFRNEKKKPLVGDYVQIAVVSQENKKGHVERIEPRRNELIRPPVANIDQALVIFAITEPEPNFHLLDTFLVRMELQGIPSIICFNKEDLDAEGTRRQEIERRYCTSGYRLIFTSAEKEEGLEDLRELLRHKCTTVAGPSGVGKSSIINLLQSDVQMETGSISMKTERGRHTTRHAELLALDKDSFIIDTPGFTSLRMDEYEEKDISHGFREIYEYEESCRFAGCSHIHEPDCGVKNAVEEGKISRQRYDSYMLMYEECKEKRRY